ncbi:putative exported protein [Sorangium cellulosum So ce56]|uniref:Exported protein n=1 Tax=Sorangium cellulosum (strain So ce56) TaxID=448385 RepID=A9GXH4_SORC5|nr:putative exported protein [Sorangium cellulosum So ce56]
MQSKSLVVIGAAALALPLACSGSPPDEGAGNGGSGRGSGGDPGEGLRFVPEGLSSTDMDEDGAGLELVAFTLVQGAAGPELYAAVRNDGETPSCDAGLMFYFIDKADQLVTTWGGSLLSGRLYRLDDGSGVMIPCIAPGEIAMTGSADLPGELVIEELGYLKHRFPAFTVDVVPVDAVTVSEVKTVGRGAGSAYTGTLENRLDVAVSDPKITVFPVNRAGRPLGMATSSAAADIPPGGIWTFETTTVGDVGAGHVAYPTVSVPP